MSSARKTLAHSKVSPIAGFCCALAERDPAAAANALAALGENSVGNEVVKYSPRFVEGLIARWTKD